MACDKGAGDDFLQAGEGGLGGEIGIGGGAAAHGDFQGRIGAQRGGIVGILIASGDLVDALTEQIEEGLLDALFETPVLDAGSDALGEAKLLVERCQEEEAAVGGEQAAGEVDLERLARKQRKRHGLLRTGHGRDGSFLCVKSIA
jgi:hypothetical protein